jgi:hypothetical protein
VPLIATARVAGQEQINFQIPSELAGSARATLVVRANGGSSAPVEVALAAVQPEIFAVTRSGGTITVWATGLGAVQPAASTGTAASSEPLMRTAVPATVSVGGTDVPVTFSGLAPGFAGLYQVNATVSPALTGDVVVRIGSAASRPFRL